MNKKFNLWENLKFSKLDNPQIPCPFCDTGFLRSFDNSLVFKEMDGTFEINDVWDLPYQTYVFSLLLSCENSNCKSSIFSVGRGYVEIIDIYDTDDPKPVKFFEPFYFYPALNIIPISSNYPKVIVDSLKKSFSLFFTDLESCANKIRICIEDLMDDKKVKKYEIAKAKKRNILNLHRRIEIFNLKYSDLGSFLLSIKWITNWGSHNSSLTKGDVLKAYEILDFVLNTLYDNPKKKMLTLTKEINKRKKPPSKFKVNRVKP